MRRRSAYGSPELGAGVGTKSPDGLASIRQYLDQLQRRRVALNEELMNCSDRWRANRIERELRAIRIAAIQCESLLKVDTGLSR